MARKFSAASYSRALLNLLDDARANAEAINTRVIYGEYAQFLLVDENSALNQKNAHELLKHARHVRRKLDALIRRSPL